MKTRLVLLAVAAAGTSLPALADPAVPDSLYSELVPYTDQGVKATMPWKGALSRAEVVAALRQAQASGTLGVAGEAYEDQPAIRVAAPTSSALKVPDLSSPRAAMGAGASAGSAPVTLDRYRFVGGEAGYVPVDDASQR